ncbi:hypothetical protein JMF89_09990 [Clostridiaceae bacterium UIB06]|uniref:GOLD domain-containing protein n=1 Tax=Clostridium thailandense TaxID=2794346 RepID=A0A949THY2_9CLOT|nr:hypothetical protein [Clostridium thailandense]MBV7273144.1 hypothetical protein [Clostridium thailandense]MCH5137530.1 hypothetical protein [Clostridiaceae bacterium UIB06]
MIDEKQQELEELSDEIEIILSVKDNISNEEIDNFTNKFHLLSENDIRSRIKEITGNCLYINNEENSEIIDTQEEKDNSDEPSISEIINEYNKMNEDDREEDTAKNNELDMNFKSESIIESRLYHEIREKIIFTEDNIPEVTFVKADTKYGQLSLEWGWPEGIEKVLISYRMDRFPTGAADSSASQVLINREDSTENGGYIIHKVIEGNYYFCIYIVAEHNQKTIFSEGTRRLVVNKRPSEIFYEIKRRKTILGKLKGVELVLSTTDKEVNLPQLVLVSKCGNMPLQKSDGETIFKTDYQTISLDKPLVLELSVENIGKNMYVKLFFLDDSNSKLYRIISPAKEKLYFK